MKRLMNITIAMSIAVFAAAVAQEKYAAASHDGMMPMTQMKQMMQDCPLKVAGVEMATADTPDGVALTFSANADKVDELRRRLERMAKMHTEPAESTAMPGKMHAIPGVAKYEPIPNGGRLVLTPKDPTRLDEFRKQVRAHTEYMKKGGGCAMMANMMRSMMGAPETMPDPKIEPNEQLDPDIMCVPTGDSPTPL